MHAICAHLGISRFSVLAHSAGAIYALALALRMPQHIRGRIHLLAPWIPPSQMTAIGLGPDKEPPSTALPYTQRLLRSLPTPFLRAANSGLFALTSNSFTSLPNSPRRVSARAQRRRSLNLDAAAAAADGRSSSPAAKGKAGKTRRGLSRSPAPQPSPAAAPGARTRSVTPTPDDLTADMASAARSSAAPRAAPPTRTASATHDPARRAAHDAALTQAIWARATTGANPAVDLLVCLERRQPIGFRYADIAKAVVVHHGARDSRVPPENARWLATAMRRCEVRILEGEGHGLMASAAVMSGVLGEIAREWADWNLVVGKRAEKRA